MNKIKCKAKHFINKGCMYCGGYKYVLIKKKCDCGRFGWMKPGPYSVYDGKHFTTIDGLEFVYHDEFGLNCIYCEAV